MGALIDYSVFVDNYARGVVDGSILACRSIQLAVKRHLHDLEHGAERGLMFDPLEANKRINFFRLLRHSKGEWAGKRFELSPSQQFIIWSIFGWKVKATGRRRFRRAYIEIPRKNGKSTIAAGVGLMMMVADGEPGAEVYSSATKREQARIVFNEAKAMVAQSPQLEKILDVLNNTIIYEGERSKFEPLASDDKTADGLNPHCNVIDELHAHQDRRLYDVLTSGSGARRQPLDFIITYAGSDKESVCYEQHKYAMQVLEGFETGGFSDDSVFAFVAGLDEGDDYRDEKVWAKANPNLGITVSREFLRDQLKSAAISTARENSVLRAHFNVWTDIDERWIKLENWDKCGNSVLEDALFGRECYGGLDLARVDDLSALVLYFPPQSAEDDGKILCKFYCPKDDIAKRSERGVPYEQWAKEGFITSTPGNTTDFAYIERDIIDLAAKFKIQELAYDRYFAHELMQRVSEGGITCVPFGQGYRDMSTPVAEIERLVQGAKLNHGGNPVLRWMVDNAVVKMDEAGNIKINKARSDDKVDGLVALAMALGRAMAHEHGKVIGGSVLSWI